MTAGSEILAHLCRINLPYDPSSFRDILTQASQTALGKSLIEAEAFAEANLQKCWALLLDLVEDDEKSGRIPFCGVIDRTARLLQNPCKQLINSSDKKKRRLGHLLNVRPDILLTIDILSAREYEAACCLTTSLVGAQRTHLTPTGDEGGVDFLAVIRQHSPCHVFSSIGREFRIVGQSKKYASKVQVGNMSQFIKTVENVRHRSGRVEEIIPAWFHASSGPIVGWMIAHSGFQTGALGEAKKHGIIVSDSRDLAEMISSSKRFYKTKKNVDRVSQLIPDIRKLLSEYPGG